jgi:RNase adapter protein RapZ
MTEHSPQHTRLIVVSGLSGSGKTVALHTLEDAGYYCIDNLPAALLAELGACITPDRVHHAGYAVGIDARNHPNDLERFPEIVEQLRAQGLDTELVFLTADDATLIQRFSETRRRHPLGGRGRPLPEAIKSERRVLAPLIEQADMLVDTTHTNIHQLRDVITARLVGSRSELSLLLQSFGFKHGVPSDADIMFDARCLPNPHWVPELRQLTGRDQAVVDYLNDQPDVQAMFADIRDFIDRWLPHYNSSSRSYLTVAIGCTGGQHRSVYLAEALSTHLRNRGQDVTCRHRELS